MGGIARHGLTLAVSTTFGQQFPWGTLLVNIIGSMAIGLFATLTGPEGRLFVPGEWRQFFMVGICGGFTTFSSFSLQTLTLALGGEWPEAILNIVLSLVLCLLGVWGGHVLAQWINVLKGA